MKSMREMLRDADPLLHESVTTSEARDCRRQAVLAAAFTARERARVEPRSRVTLLIMSGLAVILVLFFAERMWSPLASNVYAAGVRFEVKLAENKPAVGLHKAKISGTDRSVYLHPESVVTNSDISRAYIIPVEHSSQYDVGVEFTPGGAEKMHAATAKHIGEPVAILLDDRVVMTATVRAPIGKSAVISGDLSKTEAEKIVKGITAIR